MSEIDPLRSTLHPLPREGESKGVGASSPLRYNFPNPLKKQKAWFLFFQQISVHDFIERTALRHGALFSLMSVVLGGSFLQIFPHGWAAEGGIADMPPAFYVMRVFPV